MKSVLTSWSTVAVGFIVFSFVLFVFIDGDQGAWKSILSTPNPGNVETSTGGNIAQAVSNKTGSGFAGWLSNLSLKFQFPNMGM